MPSLTSMHRFLLLLACLALAPPAVGEGSVPASRAAEHVGERTVVCGFVEGTRYAAELRGRPTFLDFGDAYPEQSFTVVIWGPDRERFERPPEQLYRDKRLCVTGKVNAYRGAAQMSVERPGQIEVVSPQAGRRAGAEEGCRSRAGCCRICRKGKACGGSCISRRYTCRKGRGCACNADELCA